MEFEQLQIQEYEIEQFLDLMAKNRKPLPKDYEPCENFKYLREDEQVKLEQWTASLQLF